MYQVRAVIRDKYPFGCLGGEVRLDFGTARARVFPPSLSLSLSLFSRRPSVHTLCSEFFLELVVNFTALFPVRFDEAAAGPGDATAIDGPAPEADDVRCEADDVGGEHFKIPLFAWSLWCARRYDASLHTGRNEKIFYFLTVLQWLAACVVISE